CPACGHRNKTAAKNCVSCDTLLDRTITNRDELRAASKAFDETTIIPDSFNVDNSSIQSGVLPDLTLPNDKSDDDKLDTPVETRSLSIESEENSEAQFGKASIIGDLVLIH